MKRKVSRVFASSLILFALPELHDDGVEGKCIDLASACPPFSTLYLHTICAPSAIEPISALHLSTMKFS